ncbi:TonB-dependent receptor plug domain-containing protein [Capnocytophaga gingivalis]|jgi:tonB-linked outer membrane receptor P92|uniref:TonB-dependent receptor n=1 Tax=Capnocytophaga gingivalis TaxID=1017 RepID=UPI0028D08C62|nr:TonB-dependent receptor plug domain-containing protein [Capnocytophaga gingivalis]
MMYFSFRSFWFCVFYLCVGVLYAQQVATVKGRISAGEEPIVGAVVQLKELKKYAVADAQGNFSLLVPYRKAPYTFTIESMGYKTQEQTLIVAQPVVVLNVAMEEEITALTGITVEAITPIKQVEKSAYNVAAIDATKLTHLNSNAADMLAKASGVKVRETGGVGAESQINLNGFTGQHVRTFVDGVPISRASSFQIGNIPTELIDRIEIYKGVVPVTFGSDALGGAVNIVTRRSNAQYANLSYTFGSFNTHKSTLNVGAPLTDNIGIELNAYQNYSDNSYKVLTHYLDLTKGIYSKDRQWFKRFHDRYHNEVIIGKVNIFKEPWADKLSFSLNYNQEYKQIQNANLMQIVFGGKYQTSYTYSTGIEYEKKNLLKGLSFSVVGRYDLTTTNVVDEENRIYSWDGSYRIKPTKGEAMYQNTVFEGKTAYVAAHLDYWLSEKHFLQLTHTFSHYYRLTKSQLFTPFSSDADFMDRINQKNITGLSYKYVPNDQWTVLAFGKYYAAKVTGPAVVSGHGYLSVYEDHTERTNALGVGVGSSYEFSKELLAKLSYEKSYRLPNDRELFGDGDLEIGANQLRPEHSENLNVNLSWQPETNGHALLAEGGFALRYIQDYIIRNVASTGAATSKNHGKVLTLGGDFTLRYFYQKTFSVGGNLSYMDMRNRERKNTNGADSVTYGDRVPNMPYLFGSADATYTFDSLLTQDDGLTLGYNLVYTHEFFLSWQSEGAKITVPTQLSHDLSLTYTAPRNKYTLSVEVKNFTDALLYDNYSLQKAGRAFYVKASYRF